MYNYKYVEFVLITPGACPMNLKNLNHISYVLFSAVSELFSKDNRHTNILFAKYPIFEIIYIKHSQFHFSPSIYPKRNN